MKNRFEGKNWVDLSEAEIKSLTKAEIKDIENRQIFIRDAMPGEWFSISDELFDSAESLWKNNDGGIRSTIEDYIDKKDSKIKNTQKIISSISRSYILLVGFSFENLIKGILVTEDPSQITTGKLRKNFKSHKLVNLVTNIINLDFDSDELEILLMLQEAIPYWGRYPIPLNPNGLLPEIGIDESLRDRIVKLHSKLGLYLFNLIRDGWDSKAGPRMGFMRYPKFE